MTKRHWKNMEWNCFCWDTNTDSLEWFNVLRDDLLEDIEKAHKKKQLTDRQVLSKIIESWARYHYWSKCEWETIITDWPKYKNEYKMDVYEQLKANWEIFTDYIVAGLGLSI